MYEKNNRRLSFDFVLSLMIPPNDLNNGKFRVTLFLFFLTLLFNNSNPFFSTPLRLCEKIA